MNATEVATSLRETATGRRVGFLLALFLAIGVSFVHWVGFVLGGVVVGLVARTVPRALLGGFAVGVCSWLVFLSLLAADGVGAAYLSTGVVAVLTVAIPVAGALFGSLARLAA